MNYSAPIDKLMLWRSNNWMKYESNADNILLRLHCDQVIITSDSKVLESLNMNSKMKGIYKQDVLILFVSLSEKEIRKIKFQIKNNVTQCLQKLGEHFPVVSYNGSKTCVPPKYRNIDEVFETVMMQLNNGLECPRIPLPSEYNNFIRLCLLDPKFPQVVKQTEMAFRDILKK